MVKLSVADKEYIGRNLTMDIQTMAKNVGKSIKLVTKYIEEINQVVHQEKNKPLPEKGRGVRVMDMKQSMLADAQERASKQTVPPHNGYAQSNN